MRFLKYITQLVFWFDNGTDNIDFYKEFSPSGDFLQRLQSEVYIGKRIMFFSLYYKGKMKFIKYPHLESFSCFSGG